jgi:glyoxylase-like metal-dependent hydrolase (beta-lactamase superfamily II)
MKIIVRDNRIARQFSRAVFAVASALLMSGLTPAALAAIGDVGVYTSPPRTFSTASYWIEGDNGVVMIDTQFLPAEGLLAVDEAEKKTGKKVVAAIVLHPNPDKFNGTAVMQARGIRVITSAQVNALIPAVHQIRLGWFFDEYAPNYPKAAANPEVFGERSTELVLAGLSLKLHVLGRAASGAHVVVQHRDQVFVGDLVNPENHAWLELGLINPWLARLDEIRALQPMVVHPGRGKSGAVALVNKQADYLRDVQRRVRAALKPGELGGLTKWLLQRQIESAYPALGYPIFVRDGLAAVWRTEQVTVDSGQ